MSVGKPAFSRLPGSIKCAILQGLFVCEKCDSSAATHAACGVLLSPSSHAEWFVLRTLGEPLRLCYAVSMQVCMLHDWWLAYYLGVWAVSCVC